MTAALHPTPDPELLRDWQAMVETLARVAGVPSAILTRRDGEFIEVLRSARVAGNPYADGMRVKPAGHYCQTVIEEDRRLHVAHAPSDPVWRDAPELAYGIVSYLGYPVHWPDGTVFGTLCVLDRERNEYGELIDEVLTHFTRAVEAHLALLTREHELRQRNEELERSLAEINTLQGLLPICAECKSVRDDAGYWQRLETYLTAHSEAVISHGLCPKCFGAAMQEMAEED